MDFRLPCLTHFLLISLFLGTSSVAQPSKGGGQKGSGGGGAQQPQGQGSGGGSAYFETQMLAYGAENQLAEAVAKETCNKVSSNSTVIIYDPVSFQSLQMWETFSAAAALLETSYKTLLTHDQLKAFATEDLAKPKFGAAFISSAADAAALLGAIAASTTQNSSTFTIPDSSMAMALAHQFLRNAKLANCTGKIASLKYFPLFGAYVDAGAMKKAKDKVSEAIDGPNQIRRFIQITTPPVYANKDDPRYLAFADLNSSYDQLMAAFVTPNPNLGSQAPASPGTPPSALMSLMLGAELQSLVDQNDTYVLYADVVAAGGTQQVKKNLITLAVTGEWISYSGGLIVNVALTNSKDGELVLADTLRYRTGYRGIKRPSHSKTVEATDAGENESSLCNSEQSRDSSSSQPCK